jgi:psp operon transcriptional activator
MAAELDWPGWPGFSKEAMAQLRTHYWPGNVRELRNVIERAVYRWEDSDAPIDHIEFDPFASPWRPASAEVQAAQAGGGSTLGVSPLSAPSSRHLTPAADLRKAVETYERNLLEAALNTHRHNQRATAKALNLSYDQLRHTMRRHGMLGG